MAYRNKTYILVGERFVDTMKRAIEVGIMYGAVKAARLLNMEVIVQ